MTTEPTVQWPAKGYDPEGADLSKPLRQLLIDLKLLENPAPDDKVSIKGTPESLQIVTAGASALSKLWVTAVGGVGGSAAIVTGVKGFIAGFDSLVGAMFVVSGAVIAGTVAISVALLVRSDLTARAGATAAQFEARAKVAAAMINSYVTAPPPETRYAVLTKSRGWQVVEKFQWNKDTAEAVIPGDKLPPDEWEGLISLSHLNGATH